MRNFVCWDPRSIHDIINTEAESVPDYVFKAVHSDQTLMCAPPSGASFHLQKSKFKPTTQEEFLDIFLDDEAKHVQVAAFGRAGSGKSHLIHWMKTAIPETSKRLVLTIPKSGTSLRSIVTKIIDRLPSDAQAPYREALQRAGDSVRDRNGQKHELLNQIAQAIREETVSSNDLDGERREALLLTLPDLFQDAYIRKQYFMGDDGIISSLVDHVFSKKAAYLPSETLQRFRPEDFPSGGRDWKNASAPARDAIQVLTANPEESLPMAAEIVNRALDGSAIARAFGFTGDRIIELMDSLRKHLKTLDRELILLIEDLAQLQGIDRALLQALLNQGNSELSNIRWALAATTGVFESISNTVYTRMSLLIDMDHSAGSGAGSVTKASLANFAGRYLNATRIGSEPLREWFTLRAGDVAELPNRCAGCLYREQCHQAFGETDDGYGLYPFTKQALWNMAERADVNLEEGFNPRILQNNVLKPILDPYAEDISNGTFPPARLFSSLGGDHPLKMVERDQLRQLVPKPDYERSLAFQELWFGESALVEVPPYIRNAFALPEFESGVGGFEEPPKPDERTSTRPADALTTSLKDLDEWEGGKSMSQRLANDLRHLLFEAISSTIDWDANHLQRSYYAAARTAKPFRATSVGFLRQETQPKPLLINITVSPDDTGDGRAALACRGLLLARAQGDWGFSDSVRMLVALEDCLDMWSAQVLEQLRNMLRPTKRWNASTAALELLAIGICLASLLKAEFSIPELLNAALGAWPEESGAHTAELRAVYKRIRNDREKLVALFRSSNSGTKGGNAGSFIDPRSESVLKGLRRNRWSLEQVPPEGPPRGDWSLVASIYADTVRDLPLAASAERAYRLAWLAEMRATFGLEVKKTDILESGEELARKASDLGVGGKALKPFWECVEALKGVQLDDALRAAALLEATTEAPEATLPSYGRARANAFEVSRGFADLLFQLVQNVTLELRNRNGTLNGDATSAHSDVESIKLALDEIYNLCAVERA